MTQERAGERERERKGEGEGEVDLRATGHCVLSVGMAPVLHLALVI
jgi:hypothetical protein